MSWTQARARGPRGVILYLHGGAYVAGSPHTHRGVISRLSRAAGLPVAAPAYRLAPEHPFPAAQDDARAAWDALVSRGYVPGEIALAGDSAGGGLALSLVADLCSAGTPPAAAALFSPWTDLSASGASWRDNRDSDPILPAERVADVAGFVLAGHPARDARASPLFADYPGCPPVLFQVSLSELLRDDTLDLAARLAAEGAPVRVETWPDTPHAWQVAAGLLAEADDAITSAGRFLAGAIRPRS